MLLMQVMILLFVAIAGTAVVLTRDPSCQSVALSFYGLVLALLFFINQAPDVALSQIVVGAVALPLMVMLALAKIRQTTEDQQREDQASSRRREKAEPSEEEVA